MVMGWMALVVIQSVGAPTEQAGDVLVQLPDGMWLLQYNNSRYSCETTALCHDFRVGMQFVANMNFERKKELVDYLKTDRTWHDCLLVNCTVY
tara:strand:- start:818 stop:1096 length:279 start_codon:yes stop_codon:yes gene_type:complete